MYWDWVVQQCTGTGWYSNVLGLGGTAMYWDWVV